MTDTDYDQAIKAVDAKQERLQHFVEEINRAIPLIRKWANINSSMGPDLQNAGNILSGLLAASPKEQNEYLDRTHANPASGRWQEMHDQMTALRSEYLEINDFESALKTRPDKGAIYTNEIILGWIKDTYALAFERAWTLKADRGPK